MKKPTGMKGIRPRRLAAGLTQEELAQRLDVSRSTVAMWEAGQNWPFSVQLPALAEALGCTIDQLFENPEEQIDKLLGRAAAFDERP